MLKVTTRDVTKAVIEFYLYFISYIPNCEELEFTTHLEAKFNQLLFIKFIDV